MRIARALPAVAAVAALAACGSHAASPAAAAPSAPASCHQQYTAWKTGPARAEAEKLTPALNAVQSAASSDDIALMSSGLKQAGSIAHRLQAYPIPACADPAGYWKQILADIRASGDNAGTAAGLAGLLAAEVPLKKVPGLEGQMQTELKSTAG